MMPTCTCTACTALLAECGEELFDLYRRKLLKRGWAGRKNPVERAYIRAHRPVFEYVDTAPPETGGLNALEMTGTGHSGGHGGPL